MAYSTGSEEYQPHLAYHADGVVDIFMGLGILCFGIAILLDVAWLVVLYPAIFVPAWRLMKQSITRPRLTMGEAASVQFIRPRYTMALMGTIVAVIIGLGVTLYLITSAGTLPWLRTYLLLCFGIIAASAFTTIGFVNEVKRFYGYAALTLALFVMGVVLNVPLAIVVSVIGLVMSAGGLVLLYIFIQSH